MSARFRIVGTDLAGRTTHVSPGGMLVERAEVHVGVQRGREVVDLVPGDAPQAVFEFDVDIKGGQFKGPFIHGRDGQRFIYLSWGEVDGDEFRMFRRAKLHVDHLDPTAADGALVEGRLRLSDGRGDPLCASVREPQITWTIGALREGLPG